MLALLKHSAVVQDARTADPTGTVDVRRRFMSSLGIRWRQMIAQLRMTIVQQDMLGLDPLKPTPLSLVLQSLPDGSLIQAFQTWLDRTLETVVLEGQADYLDPMVSIVYHRAVSRAVRLTGVDVRPEDSETVIQALQMFTLTELQGICEAVSHKIMREVAGAVLNGTTPKELLRVCTATIQKVGIERSNLMVEAVVSKTHATATLDQFETAGVEQVGLLPELIAARSVKGRRLGDARGNAGGNPANATPKRRIQEWDARRSGPGSRLSRTAPPSRRTVQRIRKAQQAVERFQAVEVLTAGDNRVCPICQDIEEGNPYSINQARSLIPAHPKCRCAFVPVKDRRFAPAEKE